MVINSIFAFIVIQASFTCAVVIAAQLSTNMSARARIRSRFHKSPQYAELARRDRTSLRYSERQRTCQPRPVACSRISRGCGRCSRAELKFLQGEMLQ